MFQSSSSKNRTRSPLEVKSPTHKVGRGKMIPDFSDARHCVLPEWLRDSCQACGPDGILNEMLTYISHNLRLAILKLFNFILSVGYFPDIWNKGLITPLFKSGDKSDPNNYSGICVSSNLGKLFCSILNQRIFNFLIEHNAFSRSQIGFLPK